MAILDPAAEIEPQAHLSPNQKAWRRFKGNSVAVTSALLLGVIVALILIWPMISALAGSGALPKALAHSPEAISDAQFQPPSASHWLGTDIHGRDLLSRILYGARISLLVGVVGAAVSLIIGVLWGAVAGYVGGQLDGLMMRLVDVLYSLPSIIFVIVLITTIEGFFKGWLAETFSPRVGSAARMVFLFFGLGAVSWLTMARIVRGQVLSLRTRSFIDASRVLGASERRILFRHILPNLAGIILVYLTLTVPSVILYESFLSYLGLGIQPPQASLGSLLAEGASQINPIRIYWWLVVFPAVFLVSTLLALNLVGDGLRDAWDPKSVE